MVQSWIWILNDFCYSFNWHSLLIFHHLFVIEVLWRDPTVIRIAEIPIVIFPTLMNFKRNWLIKPPLPLLPVFALAVPIRTDLVVLAYSKWHISQHLLSIVGSINIHKLCLDWCFKLLNLRKGSLSEMVTNVRDSKILLKPFDREGLDWFKDSCVERTDATDTITCHLKL